jgi:alginate O-acetyltransferase complex protein AlgI
MLFNSYIFVFVFLPITLVGFYWLGRVHGKRPAISWLVAASFFYYGWWNPDYLLLIGVSIVVNFAIGVWLQSPARDLEVRQRAILALGLAFNIGLLGYYKYANFFVDSINSVGGTSFHLETIILPLGVSFFTFQQIAYLVDVHRGPAPRYSFLDYCLFVSFFPQLIAGPIVHHAEMLPQFSQERSGRFDPANLAQGSATFVIGFFKKVIIADSLARTVNPVFDAAASGATIGLADAWAGTLAYTFQVYFDFSGYSDMAIGIGRMFGIRLPINFDSPYKARSIDDFWRRWHVTLSRFLREYVYIPLGGNRRGELLRYVNLMATMVVGGLWHGAGWTFVFWGGLHGLYLCTHHFYQRFRIDWADGWAPLGEFFARITTLFAIVVGIVFFRATSFPAAENILASMFGAQGLVFDESLRPGSAVLWIAIATFVALLAPNTQEMVTDDRKPVPLPFGFEVGGWRPTRFYAVITSFAFFIAVLYLSRANEFLYFNF